MIPDAIHTKDAKELNGQLEVSIEKVPDDPNSLIVGVVLKGCIMKSCVFSKPVFEHTKIPG